MNGHRLLEPVTLDCLRTASHLFAKSVSCRSAIFVTEDFVCMMRLKKFTLQKLISRKLVDQFHSIFEFSLFLECRINRKIIK